MNRTKVFPLPSKIVSSFIGLQSIRALTLHSHEREREMDPPKDTEMDFVKPQTNGRKIASSEGLKSYKITIYLIKKASRGMKVWRDAISLTIRTAYVVVAETGKDKRNQGGPSLNFSLSSPSNSLFINLRLYQLSSRSTSAKPLIRADTEELLSQTNGLILALPRRTSFMVCDVSEEK